MSAALPGMQQDLMGHDRERRPGAIIDLRTGSPRLRGAHDALRRPGGGETRPCLQAVGGAEPATSRTIMLPGVSAVERRYELVDIRGPLVTFGETYVLVSDGAS